MTPLERAVRALARLSVRTERGPLRPLWALAYRALAAGVAAFISRGADDVTVYARGSFAEGDAVLGISDLDLVVVCRDGDRSRLERRWQQLGDRIPVLEAAVSASVYGETELREAAWASALTHDLAAARPSALFHATEPLHFWLRLRPGLGAPGEGWRCLTGRDRRPLARDCGGGPERWVSAWLELQCWWREAMLGLADPDPQRSAWLGVKLVAEPVRAWLWAVHGERPASRVEALVRGLEVLPEEEPALRHALELRRSLGSAGRSPLDEVLPWLVRFSGCLADQMTAAVDDAGWMPVDLVGVGTELAAGPAAAAFDGRLQPLVDPRALMLPAVPDETLAVVDGDPGDVDVLAAAAASESADVQPALPAEGVLVLPSVDTRRRPPRSVLRTIQCRATDPVTFALLVGSGRARFAELRGLSAHDLARRAVAEHRAMLRLRSELGLPAIGRLFTAARAALFLESIEAGQPQLCVTLAAVADRLAASRSRDAIEEAERAYREARSAGGDVVAAPVDELNRVVRALAPYLDD